jgi:hypothetical protein
VCRKTGPIPSYNGSATGTAITSGANRVVEPCDPTTSHRNLGWRYGDRSRTAWGCAIDTLKTTRHCCNGIRLQYSTLSRFLSRAYPRNFAIQGIPWQHGLVVIWFLSLQKVVNIDRTVRRPSEETKG